MSPCNEWRGSRGFSLIELVVVIVIVAIIFATGALTLKGVFASYFTERDIGAADAQAQLALARMTREIRTIRSPTGADLSPGTTTLDFTDTAGNQIAYQINPAAGVITRSENGGTAQTLADHVTGGQFSYTESDAATPTTTATLVAYITVQFTVREGVANTTYRATVYPRDFQ